MILVIRISGLVNMPEGTEETFFRLRMRRKFSAILMKETKENLLVLNKIRNFVAYGPIDDKTLQLLVEKRGESIDKNKKVDVKKVMDGIATKPLTELGIKQYFRLHPPIGGIDSKIHFGRKKGVLGDNKEKINDLVRRML